MRQTKKASSIRQGFAYQDHVAAVFLLEMITPGSDIQHVWLESETGKHVDDIQVETLADMHFYQVKHASDPSDCYSIGDLLDKATSRSKSILEKFVTSWRSLQHSQGKPVTLHLYTNRISSNEKNDLGAAMDGSHLSGTFRRGNAFAAMRDRWSVEADLSPSEFEKFFEALQFDMKQPELKILEIEVPKRLSTLGIPTEKYPLLLHTCLEWATHRREPVSRGDVLQLLGLPQQWGDTLSQEFPVESVYLVPLARLEEQLDKAISSMDGGYVLLTGKPGSGKSTFLQGYAEHRRADLSEDVIKYHCFVDVNELGWPRRATAEGFVSSMIRQLHEGFPRIYSSFRYWEHSEEKLSQMIYLLGQYAVEHGSKVVMIVDGLDHVARLGQQGSVRLLSEVLPHTIPKGIIFIVSAQAERYIPVHVQRLIKGNSFTMPGFDVPDTEAYLQSRQVSRLLEERSDYGLTELHVQTIHQRTEGLPLYLRYIAEQLLSKSPRDVDAFIEKLPHINDGDIGDYHRYIWDEIAGAKGDPKIRYLLAALAVTRFQAPDGFLRGVVSGEIPSLDFEDSINTISHLMSVDTNEYTGEKAYRIFHNSFKQFILGELDKSYPVWVQRLNRSLFASLQAQQNSKLGLAHLIPYARVCEEHDVILERADLDFMNRCVEVGLPLLEIKNNLRIAIDVAIEKQDLVRLVEIGLLADYTDRRFESQVLDLARFHTTLLQMGRTADVIEHLSYNGRIPENLNLALELVRILTDNGQGEAGRYLFRRIRTELRSRSARDNQSDNNIDVESYVRAWTTDNPSPMRVIEWIRGVNWNWEARTKRGQSELLEAYVQSLVDYGEREALREIREHSTDVEACRIAASAEIDLLLLDQLIEQARTVFLQVFPLTLVGESGDPGIAARAARCKMPNEQVRHYLGRAQGLPDLSRRHIHEVAAEETRTLQDVAFVLAYCGGGTELSFIRTELERHPTPYSRCLSVAVELAVAQAHRSDHAEFDYTASFQAAFSQLATLGSRGPHEAEYNWQLYGLKGPLIRLCGELADLFLQVFPARASELVGHMASLSNRPIDLRVCLAILEDLAHNAACRPYIDEALPSVAVRINETELQGEERSRSYTHLAGIAALCGDQVRAGEWLKLGIAASHCHGAHEDPVLDKLSETMSNLNKHEPTEALGRCLELASLMSWLSIVSDKSDISFVVKDFFLEVSRVNLEAGFELLEPMERDWGYYSYEDCIHLLPVALADVEPELAWELAETNTENGSRRKVFILEQVCKVAPALARQLAEMTKQAVLTESDPKNRDEIVSAYNQVASSYPDLVQPITPDLYEPLVAADRTGETPDVRVVVDGRELEPVDLEQLVSQSEGDFKWMLGQSISWQEFQSIARLAVKTATSRFDTVSSLRLVLIERFIPSARSQAEIAAIEAFADEVGLEDRPYDGPSVYAALADRCKSLGLHSPYVEYTEKYLTHVHFWRSPYYGLEREQEMNNRFSDLAVYAPERARYFVFESLRGVLTEQTYAAPEATRKLCTLLPELGLGQQLPAVYRAFFDFCEGLVAPLPPLSAEQIWLHEYQPSNLTDAELVARFLMERLAWPVLRVRERAILSLFRLAQSRTETFLPLIVARLNDGDFSIRVGALSVIDALATHVPNLVRASIPSITPLLNSNHILLVEMAEHALGQLGHKENSERHADRQLLHGTVALPRGVADLYLPSGHSDSLDDISEGGAEYVAELSRIVSECLRADIGLVKAKVRVELRRMGFDNKEVYRRDQEIAHRFYNRTEDRFTFPVELGKRHMFWHAIAQVAQDLAMQTHLPPEEFDLLRSQFRVFDPALPHLRKVPRPPGVNFAFGADPEVWMEFGDSEADIGDVIVSGEWVSLFEVTEAARDRQEFSVLRFVCLADPEMPLERYHNLLEAGPVPLMLLEREQYGQLPIHLAQQRVAISERPLVDRSGFHPILMMHRGFWELSGEDYAIATLVKPLMQRYGLQWSSTSSLDLIRSGDALTQLLRWTDGWEHAGRDASSITSSGTLMQARTSFLREITATEGKRLFEISWLTRKIKKEHYRSGSEERINKRSAGRFLNFAEQVAS